MKLWQAVILSGAVGGICGALGHAGTNHEYWLGMVAGAFAVGILHFVKEKP